MEEWIEFRANIRGDAGTSATRGRGQNGSQGNGVCGGNQGGRRRRRRETRRRGAGYAEFAPGVGGDVRQVERRRPETDSGFRKRLRRTLRTIPFDSASCCTWNKSTACRETPLATPRRRLIKPPYSIGVQVCKSLAVEQPSVLSTHADSLDTGNVRPALLSRSADRCESFLSL